MSMFDNHIEYTIGRYLSGKMNPEEQHAFLKQVADSAELAQQLEMERSIRNAFVENDLLQIRKQIQQDFQKQKQRSKRWKQIGGGLAILTIAAGLSWFSMTKNNNNELPKDLPLEITQSIENDSNSQGKSTDITPKITSTNASNSRREGINENITASQKDTSKTLSSIGQSETKKEIEIPVTNGTHPVPNSVKNDPTDICSDFDPKYELISQPSYVDAENGALYFKKTKEKLLFWLDSDSTHKSTQFTHLGAGKYFYFVKNEHGCTKGPLIAEIKTTYCKEDHFPKHYISQGNYRPEIHEGALMVSVYDKQGRSVADLHPSNGFEWNLSPTQPVGLYAIETQYPQGEKCHYSLTLFE